ncbi:MAG TPA: hypothetical protein VFP08_10755 [Acidimicrobiales bacterium]|nr:hypothetical protein [Acidimicrobiales bacterium]
MRIGVAMSGGGHRATAWGAGTILALSDAGLGPDISSVSSVSGGSITNGVVAHDVDLGVDPPDAVEASLGRLLRHLTGEGLFWFGPPTDGWLRGFLAAAVLAVGSLIGLMAAFLLAGREVAPWWLLLLGVFGVALGLAAQKKLGTSGMPTSLRRWLVLMLALIGVPAAALTAVTTWAHGWWLAVAAAVAAVLAGLAVWGFLRLFGGRGDMVARGLAAVHFSKQGTEAVLRDVDHASVHHVFCATDLQSGDAVYFTPRVVAGYRIGFGTPGDLSLAVAVQCSACLPGAFPPRVLDNSGNHRFNLQRDYDKTRPGFPGPVERLVVNDGGVYDNMADQWEQGFRDRAGREGSPLQAAEAADLLVVVNAGKSAGWTEWRAGRLLSDVPGLTRTIDILYDVSTSHRRKRFVSSADIAGSGSGGRGTLVHITTNPLAVIGRFAARGDDGQKARAAAARRIVLDVAGDDEWDTAADKNASVKTTLGRLSVEDVARLVWHAYVLTWIGLWVVHDVGGAPDPARLSLDRFRQLARPDADNAP